MHFVPQQEVSGGTKDSEVLGMSDFSKITQKHIDTANEFIADLRGYAKRFHEFVVYKTFLSTEPASEISYTLHEFVLFCGETIQALNDIGKRDVIVSEISAYSSHWIMTDLGDNMGDARVVLVNRGERWVTYYSEWDGVRIGIDEGEEPRRNPLSVTYLAILNDVFKKMFIEDSEAERPMPVSECHSMFRVAPSVELEQE